MNPVVLEVEHLTRYDYSQPVSMAQHLAILEPLSDQRQRLLSFELLIDPPPPNPPGCTVRSDSLGNRLRWFQLEGAHDHLCVTARSRVALAPRASTGPWADPGATPTCAAVAQALRYDPGQVWQPAVEFLPASPFVPRLAALRAYAEPSLRAERPMLEAVIELMHRIHTEFAYQSRSTEIDTPLQQVMDQRAGVCQDFAHLLIGMCRAHGLPARYVSGYLLTRPVPGQPALVGADASHAWAQVWCPLKPGSPDGHWVDLDPTNDLMPDQAHIRVAVGRDFGDVTPLRGVIRGGGRHRLQVGVTTRALDVAPA